MLTGSALQSASSTHRFVPAVRKRFTPADSIAWAGAPISFGRNEEIYSESEPADHLYKVVSGIVRTCKVLIDGRRKIGAFYLPSDTFGLEIGEERTFSAEAVVDTKVLAVKRSVVGSLELWTLMGCELQRAQDHLLLLVKTAPERMASFLLEMAARIQSSDEVELAMSRQDIADYLGLTIETISRTLTQLESQSAIALPTCKRIVLRNRAALKRLSLSYVAQSFSQHSDHGSRSSSNGASPS
jgi:CRP/FNR family transcriptional regulator, nitrogen fixation regulation protein